MGNHYHTRRSYMQEELGDEVWASKYREYILTELAREEGTYLVTYNTVNNIANTDRVVITGLYNAVNKMGSAVALYEDKADKGAILHSMNSAVDHLIFDIVIYFDSRANLIVLNPKGKPDEFVVRTKFFKVAVEKEEVNSFVVDSINRINSRLPYGVSQEEERDMDLQAWSKVALSNGLIEAKVYASDEDEFLEAMSVFAN